MRVGILGAGWAGSTHAEAYARMPDVRIAGIVGRRESRVGELARRLNCPAFTDPARLLDDESVEAVSVCYPTRWHIQYVTAALQRGKHVLCETPLALTLAEADAMIAAARANGKLLLVAQVMRFVDKYVYIRDKVQAGDLGKVLAVTTTRLSSDRAATNRSATEFGPPAVELMIHDFDYVNWLLGLPGAVRATGVAGPTGVIDHAYAALEYQGSCAEVEGSVLMPVGYPFSTALRVVCEKGTVETHFRLGTGRPDSTLHVYPSDSPVQEPATPDEDPYWAECHHFVECILNRADPERIGAEAARDGLRVALAAEESLLRSGDRVPVL